MEKFECGGSPWFKGIGDKAVWKIVDRESEDRVARVSIDQRLPRDVDTWDDYVEVCKTFGFEPERPL